MVKHLCAVYEAFVWWYYRIGFKILTKHFYFNVYKSFIHFELHLQKYSLNSNPCRAMSDFVY